MLDVDTADERVLTDALNRHGQTPVVVRTGSGKFHALYRFNNEKRAIRAWDDLPIDLLGAGLAIAPPSLVAKGQYQIIHGHLDDLDRLPIMRELDARLYADASGPRPQKQGEGRNNDLWRRAMREGDAWILLYRRRRMGRVVPDKERPGMWRSVKVDGNLSDTANLCWSKDNVMAQVLREVAWDAANDPQKCPVKRVSREQKSSPMRLNAA